jgi:hypothetical protein
MTVRTATPETIERVWPFCQQGDTLVLVGRFVGWEPRDRSFSMPLTIDATQAVLSGFHATTINGVTFAGGKWRAGGGKAHGLRVDGGKRLRIHHPDLHSDTNATGNGLYMQGGEDIAIEDPIAVGFLNSILFSRVNGYRVTGGDLSRMGSDGIDGYSSYNGLIEDAYIHDNDLFGESHPDGVQISSEANAPKAVNVRIRRLRIKGRFQGICGFNHPKLGQHGFEHIYIEDNEIEGMYVNGIALYDCAGGAVRRNKIWTLPGFDPQARIIIERCTDVIREGNAVAPAGGRPAITDPGAKPLTETPPS